VTVRPAARVAIVTGAAHGLGRAICVELAREGAAVWACDVRASELEATRAAVEQARPGAGHAAVVDVREAGAVDGFVGRVVGAAGRVDVLVNTAGGVAGQTMRPIEEVGDADWRVIFAINLDGAFHFTRAVAPAMKRAGGGAIVNISSGAPDRLHPPDRARAGAARHPRQLHRARLRALEPRLRGPVARHG
jgi:3-oxoacyl-[acyl-carrier protein] reductase